MNSVALDQLARRGRWERLAPLHLGRLTKGLRVLPRRCEAKSASGYAAAHLPLRGEQGKSRIP